MAWQKAKEKSDVLKPNTLIEPLIGIYQGSESGKYSPIHAFLVGEEEKIVKVRGCTSLNRQLASVEHGTHVHVRYLKSVPTMQGNDMIIMEVLQWVPDDDGDETETMPAVVPLGDNPYPPSCIEFVNHEDQKLSQQEPAQLKNNVLARFGFNVKS